MNDLIKAERELASIHLRNEKVYQVLRSELVEKYGEDGVCAVERQLTKEAEEAHAKDEFCSEAGRRAWK